MTFKNCFFIDNDFYFFDQEWKDENLPLEYILYRSIMYTISLRRYINIQEILKKYNLEQYIDVFKKLDEKMQEKIRDKEIWEYYSENHSFNIDETKQEMINMQIRDKAKDLCIENLQKKTELLENMKMTSIIKSKVKKYIRRKNNE